MNTEPEKNSELARAPEAVRQRSPRAAGSAPARSASAYTPKPGFDSGDEPPGKPTRKGRWLPWAAAVVAAGALAFGGWHAWQPHPARTGDVLILTAADIDQAATASAREMLARGETPLSLMNVSPETRRAVADGSESLYTKQLLPPETPPGDVIHVTVTEGGEMVGVDLLTSDHPVGTTFAARNNSPLHFHFAVESVSPRGPVVCSVGAESGSRVYTAPMPKGGDGDLEALTR